MKAAAVSNPVVPRADDQGPLLAVEHLVKHFPQRRSLAFWEPAPVVRAVDGVSFSIRAGETYGLVGESGSGKSTIARMVLLLERPTAGVITFEGQPITAFSRGDLRRYRTSVQAVFQNPRASLNPRMRVSEIIGELPMLHQGLGRSARKVRVEELMTMVGLPPGAANRFPHEFSGGQLQRIAIARAIATNPRLLVLDEPVSALDVSIRAQVLNLLSDLQERLRLTYLLIAHDLAIVQNVSDRVGVLYLGKLVEECSSEDLTRNPLHPYTQALLSAVPIPDPTQRRDQLPVKGEIGSALNPPSGCRFHPRCPLAIDRCAQEEPPMVHVTPDHRVACHLVPAPNAAAQEPQR